MNSVFKYRSGSLETFDRDLESLTGDYFWASNFENLNDPCEAIIDIDTFKNQLNSFIRIFARKNKIASENLQKVFDALNNLLSREIGIFSLSQKYDDELLWAHYSNSHKGFCVEYDLNILTKNASMRKYYAYPVTYTDKPPTLTIDDMNNLSSDMTKNIILAKYATTKSERWSYEDEIRLITDKWGKQPYDYRALKAIYFGLRMSGDKIDEIMSALRNRGVQYFQIILNQGSYEFTATQIKDKYSDGKKYLYNISPVLEDAVMEEYIPDDYRHCIPYLYKAIEVARRDPYSKQINYAEINPSRGTPRKPVIFVNCEKTNDEYCNMYYTKDEIDELYSKIDDL